MPLLFFKQGIANEVMLLLEEKLALIESKLQEIILKLDQTNKESLALSVLRSSLKDVLDGKLILLTDYKSTFIIVVSF